MLANSTTDQEPRPTPATTKGVLIWAKLRFEATRPKFFTASILPVLLGSAWAYPLVKRFDWAAFLLALTSVICVHGAANVLNDVYDDEVGSDRQNTERVYPYTGGSRFIQNGVLTRREMAVWGASLLAAGFALGLGLVALKGWTVLAIGLLGLLLAVVYSMPPLRLADRGLGEIAVGIAFGVLPVIGTAWLQAGVFEIGALLVSLPISCWIACVLLINEVPDAPADRAAGRRNWVVRLGTDSVGAVFLVLNLGAALSIFGILLRGEWSWWIAAGVLALLMLAWRVYRLLSGARRNLRAAIETNLAIHAFGSVWLTGWALAGGLR